MWTISAPEGAPITTDQTHPRDLEGVARSFHQGSVGTGAVRPVSVSRRILLLHVEKGGGDGKSIDPEVLSLTVEPIFSEPILVV